MDATDLAEFRARAKIDPSLADGVHEIVWHAQSLGTMPTATICKNFHAGDSELGVDLSLLFGMHSGHGSDL